MADPDIAEKAIADGKIDAVVLGRQTIADPDYANKIVLGKTKEIKTCIACNQGCIWGHFTSGKISCAVNPCVGYEKEYELKKVQNTKKIVVVGGGLVGCEIAYGYTKEGKKVTIVEALDEIMKLNDVPLMNKIMLFDAFEYYGTKILTSTKLKAINDEGAVVITNDGQEKTIKAFFKNIKEATK